MLNLYKGSTGKTYKSDYMTMQEATDIRYARIYDRIFEMCYPMEFSGVSWRKREAAQRYEETRKILEG